MTGAMEVGRSRKVAPSMPILDTLVLPSLWALQPASSDPSLAVHDRGSQTVVASKGICRSYELRNEETLTCGCSLWSIFGGTNLLH